MTPTRRQGSKRSKRNSIKRILSILTFVKKPTSSFYESFTTNHRGASAPLLFLKCYEIHNGLSSLYDNHYHVLRNIGSQPKSSLFRLFNNQLGGDKAMIKLKINTENAAFDQEGQEVARILRGLADRLENLDKLQECQLPLRDLNGNTVGYYQTWTDQGESQGAVISSPYATWTQNQFPN